MPGMKAIQGRPPGRGAYHRPMLATGPAPRYAVYFAPAAGHALWEAGCGWLGRDPRHPPPATAPPPHRGAPWRYGFHATLKAPMRLREGAVEADLLRGMRALARDHAAFAMPALQVDWLDRFIALRPAAPVEAAHPLRRLADACQLSLDAWRAEPTPAESARHGEGLSPRQREQARRLGYPHVLDDWRFHMTLSERFDDTGAPDARRLIDQARRHFTDALRAPLPCDALCLFIEPSPGAPFALAQRVELAGAAAG